MNLEASLLKHKFYCFYLNIKNILKVKRNVDKLVRFLRNLSFSLKRVCRISYRFNFSSFLFNCYRSFNHCNILCAQTYENHALIFVSLIVMQKLMYLLYVMITYLILLEAERFQKIFNLICFRYYFVRFLLKISKLLS